MDRMEGGEVSRKDLSSEKDACKKTVEPARDLVSSTCSKLKLLSHLSTVKKLFLPQITVSKNAVTRAKKQKNILP